ncbi:MAG: ribonuclease HII [Actinomycetota bacterium]|nr:ribonuclease HII [Actinomycetota bacterium]
MIAPTGNYEAVLNRQGFGLVAGADEAGRGALAGPLVAAAVILPCGWVPEGLNDSKLLTALQRERLYAEILEHAVSCGVFRTSCKRLDAVGLQRANLAALRGALRKLDPKPDYILVDGFALARMPVPCLRVVKGDQVCTSVAAASVVAKVTRDRIMLRAHRRYPGYDFANNKGYRAPAHLEALRRLGPCEIHRRCFAPVSQVEAGTWPSYPDAGQSMSVAKELERARRVGKEARGEQLEERTRLVPDRDGGGRLS